MNKLFSFIFFFFFLVIFSVSCSSSKNANQLDEASAEQMEQRDMTVSLEDRLRKVPGVTVSGSGADASVNIRGSNSILGSSEPLFVVGGVAVGGFSDARQIVNVAEIKSIRVLKSSAQTAMYGTRGASGVIKITLLEK
jgi:TonB-dependent SusC/RagA subfamily outer membrane receptor